MNPSETMVNRADQLTETFERVLRRHVEEICGPSVPNLHDALAYALGTDIDEPALRGKRVRPLLCLVTAEALGARVEAAYPFALSIEFMHNFCLVHDDIEDGDIMRRGRASVWVEYGLPHAINIGDYLLVQSMRVITDWTAPEPDRETRFRLLSLLGHTLDRTHIGQAMDMNARERRDFFEEDYFELVREKTGYYLATPIQGGAIIAAAPDDVIAKLGDLAHLLGPLFQIVDDVIDLTEGKGRESPGSDLREGKRSYLVARTQALCTEAEREQLFTILDTDRDETTTENIAWAKQLFEHYGAFEAAERVCKRLDGEVKTLLGELPKALALALEPILENLTRRQR